MLLWCCVGNQNPGNAILAALGNPVCHESQGGSFGSVTRGGAPLAPGWYEAPPLGLRMLSSALSGLANAPLTDGGPLVRRPNCQPRSQGRYSVKRLLWAVSSCASIHWL